MMGGNSTGVPHNDKTAKRKFQEKLNNGWNSRYGQIPAGAQTPTPEQIERKRVVDAKLAKSEKDRIAKRRRGSETRRLRGDWA